MIQSTCVQNLTTLALTISKISLGARKCKKGSHDPDHTLFVSHMLGPDITGVQNLITEASAIPELWLVNLVPIKI